MQANQRSGGSASTSARAPVHNGHFASFARPVLGGRRRLSAGTVEIEAHSDRFANCFASRDANYRQRWPNPTGIGKVAGRSLIGSIHAAESSVPGSADEALNADASSTAVIPKSGGLVNRVLAGVALGAMGACVITQGGLLYLAFMVFFIYQASREYFGFVTLIEVKEGLTPPPPWASALVTLCCMALPVYTFITKGKIAVALAIASFIILSVIATTNEKPTLSSFAQAIFGLLYCGYLPTYWIKLRMLEIPAIHTTLATWWPTLLGGLSHVTVGFVATFMAIACIVAADCGAYFVGKTFGRTPLTRISPKKTVEGAVGGLMAAVGVSLLLRAGLSWPLSQQAAVGLAVIVFLSSILGDIIESVMKRDAGMKDSGSLIPGHGGVLDRFDSYIFTGAVVHLYMKFIPYFGV